MTGESYISVSGLVSLVMGIGRSSTISTGFVSSSLLVGMGVGGCGGWILVVVVAVGINSWVESGWWMLDTGLNFGIFPCFRMGFCGK